MPQQLSQLTRLQATEVGPIRCVGFRERVLRGRVAVGPGLFGRHGWIGCITLEGWCFVLPVRSVKQSWSLCRRASIEGEQLRGNPCSNFAPLFQTWKSSKCRQASTAGQEETTMMISLHAVAPTVVMMMTVTTKGVSLVG